MNDSSVKQAIVIGAGMGDGSMKAAADGLRQRAKSDTDVKLIGIEFSTVKYSVLSGAFTDSWITSINGNTVATSSYMDNEEIVQAYFAFFSDVRYRTTDRLKALKDAELEYITARVSLTDEALTEAFTEAGSTDLIVINGSEFTSEAEQEMAINEGVDYICLFDTYNFKNKVNKEALDADAGFTLYASGKDGQYHWHIYKAV